jgi:hypothetical protein
METVIIGGLPFALETQPSAMKFALPFAWVPTSTTGIGYVKMLVPAETWAIDTPVE